MNKETLRILVASQIASAAITKHGLSAYNPEDALQKADELIKAADKTHQDPSNGILYDPMYA